MNTNIIFGLGQGRGMFGAGAVQVGRFGWKMRTTALVVALTSGGCRLPSTRRGASRRGG